MSQVILISDDSDGENKTTALQKNASGGEDNERGTDVGNCKRKVEMKEENDEKPKKKAEMLFNEFVDYCSESLGSHEHCKKILSYLQSKHNNASTEYTNSRQYTKLLYKYVRKLRRGSTKTAVFILDITTILDAHKQTQNNKRKLSDKETGNAQDISEQEIDNFKESTKKIKLDETHPTMSSVSLENPSSQSSSVSMQNNDQEPAQSSCSTSNGTQRVMEGSNEKCSNLTKRERRINYLERLLKQLSKEITRLQQQDLSLDEMNENDSVYIQESLLKKRCMQVYKKLCSLNQLPNKTGRVREQVIKVRSSRFEEINKKIEQYINDPAGPFPDFNDIYILVKKANEKNNLQLSESTINSTAQNIFTEIGEKLQKRRQQDFVYEFGSSLMDNVKDAKDPAEYDDDLKRKLTDNRKLARMNLDSVIEKYSKIQYEKAEEDDARIKVKSDPGKEEPLEEEPPDEDSQDEDSQDEDSRDEDLQDEIFLNEESLDEEIQDENPQRENPQDEEL